MGNYLQIIFLIFSSISFYLQAQEPLYNIKLNKELSSAGKDYAPNFMNGGSPIVLFTSEKDHFSTVLCSFLKDGKWDSAVPLIRDAAENFSTISFDWQRNVAFYTKCPLGNGPHNKCGIYYSFLPGGGLPEESLPIEIPIIGKRNDFTFRHPFFSKELDLIFFAANLPGSIGGLDIWFSKYNRKNDSWGIPQNAGPGINTRGTENHPFADGKGNLFFSSNHHNSLGGFDIFKSFKIKDSLKWNSVVSLNAPINSVADDISIFFTDSSNRKGYFSSNRSGGKGKEDIYEFYTQGSKDSIVAMSDESGGLKKEQQQKLSEKITELLKKAPCELNSEGIEVSDVKISTMFKKNQFTVSFNSNSKTNFKVRIHDQSGTVLITDEVKTEIGIFSKQYPLEKIKKGIYYVSILYKCELKQLNKTIVQ